MPYGSVRITKPLNRLIYINGNTSDPSGTSPGPFVVELGSNKFETVNGAGEVDWRGRVVLTPKNRNVELELERA